MTAVVTPPRRSYVIGAVFCQSFCEQDNSRTRLRMSTKHSRHGQGMTRPFRSD